MTGLLSLEVLRGAAELPALKHFVTRLNVGWPITVTYAGVALTFLRLWVCCCGLSRDHFDRCFVN